MLTLADNFQIGAALTLLVPLGLLLALAVWFMFVFRRVPKHTPESSTALPPPEMVAAAGDAIHELTPIDDPPLSPPPA
jgi:hypothetical protein